MCAACKPKRAAPIGFLHNNRLQPFWVQLGTSAAPSANACLVYNYYSVANPTSCAIPGQGTGNNGNVMGYLYQDTSNPGLGHMASYTYDALNRLTNSVATGSSTHNLTFGYDRFGNMTCVTNAQTQGPCPNWSFNSTTNRVTNTGFSYDPAGKLTQDGTSAGSHTYQWDAEGRLKSVDNGATATYVYNAFGQRVEKQLGTGYTEILLNCSGQPLGENDRTGWAQVFIPMGERHLAHYANSGTYFPHVNRLGSTAQVSDYSGAIVQDLLFYPYGQQWLMAGTMQEDRFAQLGHRDGESGLDPTVSRMVSSGLGRWFTPDAVRGDPGTPQSLNLYTYVAGNPINRVDPKGLFWFYPRWDWDWGWRGGWEVGSGFGLWGWWGCSPFSGCGGGGDCDWWITNIRCPLCQAACDAKAVGWAAACGSGKVVEAVSGDIIGAIVDFASDTCARVVERKQLACLNDCDNTWCNCVSGGGGRIGFVPF